MAAPLVDNEEKHGAGAVHSSTLHRATIKASGTFNPLCRVLCILQSLYLCAIGSMVVALVASHLSRDTPRTSNCSPKQLYTWMRPDAQGQGRLQRAGTSCGTVSLVGVKTHSKSRSRATFLARNRYLACVDRSTRHPQRGESFAHHRRPRPPGNQAAHRGAPRATAIPSGSRP